MSIPNTGDFARYDQPDWNEKKDDIPDWECNITLGIDDVRMFHSLLKYYHEGWPGYPARPPEEQEFAIRMRNNFFAMIQDHSFSK